MKNSTPSKQYLFDTYALIELIRGNPAYDKYVRSDAIVNNFILAELAYNIIKYYDKKTAEAYVEDYSINLVHTTPEVILEAMKFRYDNKKKKMSIADCTGYMLAKNLGIKFLTGDKEFEGMENVEFVK